jgi:hypothetical protein
MRLNRKFKAFIYWAILIGYFVGMFILWKDFKEKSTQNESGSGGQPIIKKIED